MASFNETFTMKGIGIQCNKCGQIFKEGKGKLYCVCGNEVSTINPTHNIIKYLIEKEGITFAK